MKHTLYYYIITLFICLISCQNKRENIHQGHVILVNTEENNKFKNNILISTNNDTSYYNLYNYKDYFGYVNNFDNETISVMKMDGQKPYIFNLGMFIDIENATVIKSVDDVTFSILRKNVIENNTFIYTDNLDNLFGIGLLYEQDSLFYFFDNKDKAKIFLKNINEILKKKGYDDIVDQIKQNMNYDDYKSDKSD